MLVIHWPLNTIRNKVRPTFLGRLLADLFRSEEKETICFISATRLSEKKFWDESPLGISIKPFLQDASISTSIAFENTNGLPLVYNNALKSKNTSNIVVFLHDDVWLDDIDLIEKLRLSLRKFDVVGLAGNQRIQKNQPTWAHRPVVNKEFIWDNGHLSGEVRHGNIKQSEITVFGPSPAKCELMDGVMLAGKRSRMLRSNTWFDERFKFHFYDLDFCRTARRAGLALGTWPINIIHESGGAFGSPTWWDGYAVYIKKWKH